MATPQYELDQLNTVLHGENIDLLRDTLAFAVADCMVKYHDPGLLKQFPSWVGELVQEMCALYRLHGHYRIVSNLGEVDHSEMVGKLVKLLELGA